MSDAISEVVDGAAVVAQPPKAEVVAKAAPVTRTRLLEPGSVHTYRHENGLLFAFTLPPEVTGPVFVKFCDFDPNWLGRNAEKMRAHASFCENGVVVMQPSGKGHSWKANVFPFGRFTVAMPETEARDGDDNLAVHFYDNPNN